MKLEIFLFNSILNRRVTSFRLKLPPWHTFIQINKIKTQHFGYTCDCLRSICDRLSLIQSLVCSSSFSSSKHSLSKRLFSSWPLSFFEQRRHTRSNRADKRLLYRLMSSEVDAYDGVSSKGAFLFLRNGPMWFSRSNESLVVSSHVCKLFQWVTNTNDEGHFTSLISKARNRPTAVWPENSGLSGCLNLHFFLIPWPDLTWN